jgi:murein DD-endopeptidase MepM/ murein hydrolase activator NlpD
MVALTLCSGCAVLGGKGASRKDRVYQVRSGDTLDSIGKKHGVIAGDIQRYNAIKDPRAIQVGQKIVIPSAGPLGGEAKLQPESSSDNLNRAQLRMVSLAPVRSYVGGLQLPVEGARASSRFGWRWSRFHEGLDLAAPEGTPVMAAHDGVVVLASESWGRYGKVIVVKGEGLMTVYGHNSDNKVNKGARVRRGQVIAEVGQTGDASGPHLHFETRVLDDQQRFSAVNPVVFFPE